MNNYKDLKVWNEAIEASLLVYQLVKTFPSDEKFGLISQIKRSSISISSNIAEGAGRNSKKEFNHFIGIASGSCFELESQMILSHKLNFIEEEQLDTILEKLNYIKNMLFKLKKSMTDNVINNN